MGFMGMFRCADMAGLSLRRSIRCALLASTSLAAHPALAQTLPTGGSVAAGSVEIGTAGGAMTVRQGSARAIVNWTDFSIGQGDSVRFVQPDSGSAILNRVTGAATSSLAGTLSANGQVYLVNPNGIAITATGAVKVGGGFVASTLDIADKDFLSGHLAFRGEGASAGVSNAGIVSVGPGGYAALIGGTVRNDGLIAVPLGKAGLGSGEQATLDLSGDGFLQVAVPTRAGAEGKGALVENGGIVSADGGTVVMRAATALEAARNAVNLSGVAEAATLSGRDGEIVIGGGAGGEVAVSGTARATAAGTGSGGKGGTIEVTGRDIALTGATLDASGAGGGGTVRLGGDRRGAGDLPRARTTSVDAASTIRADATGAGDGGSVVVWSDEATRFDGRISARGAGTGRGGEAEVSGKAVLSYTGRTDLSAQSGAFGTLLLDPYNLTISGATSSGVSGFAANANDSVLNVATLTSALASANVTVSTGTGGSQAGNITVAAPVSWSAGTTLTLTAAGSIAINAGITATGANAGLALNSGGAVDYALAPGAAVTLSGAGSSFSVNGQSYTLIHDMAGLSAIDATNLSGFYALAGDLDASGTVYTDALVGSGSSAFVGTFAGLGHTLSGLTINAGSKNYVGLFGVIDGTVRDIGLVGSSVTGGYYVGGLAGMNYGTISRSYATGAVNGIAYVGGLAGVNNSAISQSYATGAVSGSVSVVGGLVGSNYGTIGQSYATGIVSGKGGYIGGLVGLNSSAIGQSYATGAVSGQGSDVGGLVGSNSGTISQTYATGAVNGIAYVGGLAGVNSSAISQSYATGAVGGGSYVGGLVGYNSNLGAIGQTYATGRVNGSGSFVGGLIGLDTGATNSSYFDTQTTGQTRGVGPGSEPGVTGLTTAQARSAGNYSGWDFNSVWYQAGDMRPILRAEAASPAGGVAAIANLHQLALVNTAPGGSYVLAADIDAGATNAAASGYDPAGIWGASGWQPLGASSSGFTGTFDGAGHTISGLTVKANSAYAGLFGNVRTGTVENVGLVGGTMSGGGGSYVGGLAGINQGTISRSYATGTVSGGVGGDVGGLVGNNQGTIGQSYATGTVSGGGGSYVGGLAGINYGTISQSYTTGTVSGGSDVGGLAGNNEGTIGQSYATGAVSGSDIYIGGLVGYNDSNGTLTQSYATAKVSGSGYVGGLVGENLGTIGQSYATGKVVGNSNASAGGLVGENDGAISTSYFDTQTTGRGSGVGNGGTSGVTGLTTAQARSAGSYSGWDFDTVWYQAGDMRPILRAEAAAPVGGVTAIANLHQLALVNTALGGSYVLAADLDAGATNAAASGYDPAGIWGPSGWQPLGPSFSSNFTGTFNGAGHTISGLTVNAGSIAGLFGVVGSGGTVENVGLVGGSVNGGNNSSVGDLAGANFGTIYQTYATGAVSGGTVGDIGGLVGDNYGTISRSYATGAVVGNNSGGVGGLVGFNTGTISQSYATGGVSGSGYYLAGLAGANGGTIGASFFDTQTTGQTNGTLSWGGGLTSGVTGLTTAAFQNPAAFYNRALAVGWDFQAVWAPSSAGYYPQLYALSRVVSVMADNQTMTYGGAVPVLTGSLYGGGPGVYLGGGSRGLLTPTFTTGASSASGVGSYVITGTSQITDSAGNIWRVATIPVNGTLTVNPAPLTVTAGSATKTYNGQAWTGGVGAVIVGFVNGETPAVLGGTFAYGGSAQGAIGAGSYALTASGLTAGNYAITYVPGTLTVNQAPLTVTARDADKTYDGLAWTGGNGVGYAGFVNGETASVLGGTLGYGGAAQGAIGAGSYGLTASGLTSANYAITYLPGTLTVNKAPLTVTAQDAAKTYDGLAWTGGAGVGYAGFVNGETSAVLGGTLGYGGAAQGAIGAGSYGLTASGLTSGNYAITYLPGTLTVNKAPLTVTARDAGKTYDGLAWTGGNGVGYAGFVNGETAAVLGGTLGYGGSAQGAVGAGSYALTASGLTSGNYAITYLPGTLTVNKAPLTVTARDAGKTYDGLAWTGGNGVGYAGFVNGETAAVLGGTLGYGGSAQGAVGAGSYALTASGLTSGNYAITYVPGTLTVNPAPLTVTARDADKTYDGLAWTGGNGVIYAGFVNGETSAVLGGTLAYGGSAQGAVGAGSYAITASGLTAANYVLTYLPGTLTVEKAPLTVTAPPPAASPPHELTGPSFNKAPWQQSVAYAEVNAGDVGPNAGSGISPQVEDTLLSSAVCFADRPFPLNCGGK